MCVKRIMRKQNGSLSLKKGYKQYVFQRTVTYNSGESSLWETNSQGMSRMLGPGSVQNRPRVINRRGLIIFTDPQSTVPSPREIVLSVPVPVGTWSAEQILTDCCREVRPELLALWDACLIIYDKYATGPKWTPKFPSNYVLFHILYIIHIQVGQHTCK
jgi:hypothetical protein